MTLSPVEFVLWLLFAVCLVFTACLAAIAFRGADTANERINEIEDDLLRPIKPSVMLADAFPTNALDYANVGDEILLDYGTDHDYVSAGKVIAAWTRPTRPINPAVCLHGSNLEVVDDPKTQDRSWRCNDCGKTWSGTPTLDRGFVPW